MKKRGATQLLTRNGNGNLSSFWCAAMLLVLAGSIRRQSHHHAARAFMINAAVTQCTRRRHVAMTMIRRRQYGFIRSIHRHSETSALLPRYLSSSSFLHSSSSPDESNTLPNMTGWTVKEALDKSLLYLTESDAPEPESSVTQLMASALDLPWENGFVLVREVSNNNNDDGALANRKLTLQEATHYQEMLLRRIHKEPLQYILGQWDFLEYTFVIRPPLLCPRPETEELVLFVKNDIQQQQHQYTSSTPIRILDIGCGTGIIGVSLAVMLSNANVTAIDLEPIAVQTSNENAQRLLLNKSRYQAILCSAGDFESNDVPFDVIVSNPPYIPQDDMATLADDVVGFESQNALCGGEDGMNVIRDIVHGAPQWGRSGTVVWVEVDPTHPELLRNWLDEDGTTIGVVFDSTHQDLYGRDRFVKLRVL